LKKHVHEVHPNDIEKYDFLEENQNQNEEKMEDTFYQIEEKK
jgi:hypothetical protein